MIYNGEPLKNDLPLKVYENNFELFFNAGTTITQVDIPEIPPHTFQFKPFQDFFNGDFVVDCVYVLKFSDVIGIVQTVTRTQVAGAGKKACVYLTLTDEGENELDFTLWESYANQFMAYTAETESPVIILTHAWYRQSSENGKLYISNSWNGSKLLINLDHPQVVGFKARCVDVNPSQMTSQTRSLNSCSQGQFDVASPMSRMSFQLEI